MKHLTKLTLSAAIVALALPGFAQTATTDSNTTPPAAAFTPGENFLTNWDADGDGKVTLAEVQERRADLFAGFDANEDGTLTPDELADLTAMRDVMRDAQERPALGRGPQGGPQGNMPGPMAQGQRFGGGQAMGHHGGGRGGAMQQGWGQQQQGWGQQPGRGFNQGYGYGPQGMPQQQGWGQGPQAMMPPQGQGYGMGPGNGMAPGYGQGFGQMQGQMQGGFAQRGMGQNMGPNMTPATGLDTNRDGAISQDEFTANSETWFTRFDRNSDGVIDAQDFPGAPGQPTAAQN